MRPQNGFVHSTIARLTRPLIRPKNRHISNKSVRIFEPAKMVKCAVFVGKPCFCAYFRRFSVEEAREVIYTVPA